MMNISIYSDIYIYALRKHVEKPKHKIPDNFRKPHRRLRERQSLRNGGVLDPLSAQVGLESQNILLQPQVSLCRP